MTTSHEIMSPDDDCWQLTSEPTLTLLQGGLAVEDWTRFDVLHAQPMSAIAERARGVMARAAIDPQVRDFPAVMQAIRGTIL